MPLGDVFVNKMIVPEDPEFARFIRTQVDQRTGGRIHDLRVEVTDGRVRVHGYTEDANVRNTNHLALLAVWQVLGVDDPELVELDIQVVKSGSYECSAKASTRLTR